MHLSRVLPVLRDLVTRRPLALPSGPPLTQTDSKYTLMVSGTGHAGMEACIANLVEPGDKVVVGNAGIWGDRVAEMSRRFRGEGRPGGACT